MKTTLILLFSLISFNAFAEEEMLLPLEIQDQVAGIETVQASSGPIKILGSGVVNSATNQSIALVCVGKPVDANTLEPACDLVRFGLFQPGSAEVTLLGAVLKVPTGPAELQKKALKLVIRQYFDSHMTEGQKHKRYFWAHQFPTYVAAGVLIVGVSIFATPAAGGGMAISGGAFAAVGGLTLTLGILLSGTSTADFLGSNFTNGTSVSFTSQDGWNWSSRAKSVSEKKFNNILSSLQYGDNSGVDQYLGEYSRRNRRQREKLETQGVQF